MSTHDSDLPRRDVTPPQSPSQPPRRLWLWAVPAALAAAVAAWAAGETRRFWVEPEKVEMVTMGTKHLGTNAATVQAAGVATSGRLQGAFGALLGLALGAAGGLATRSPGRAAAAALLGAACGAAAGFAASYLAIPVYERSRGGLDDIVLSMLVLGAIAAPIGASAALALAVGARLGAGQVARCITGGVVGALIAAALCVVVGAAFFGNDATGEPISKTAQTRLIARVLVAALTAVVASTIVGEGARARGRSHAAG